MSKTLARSAASRLGEQVEQQRREAARVERDGDRAVARAEPARAAAVGEDHEARRLGRGAGACPVASRRRRETVDLASRRRRPCVGRRRRSPPGIRAPRARREQLDHLASVVWVKSS